MAHLPSCVFSLLLAVLHVCISPFPCINPHQDLESRPSGGPFKFETGKSKGGLPTLQANRFSWFKVISRWDKQETTRKKQPILIEYLLKASVIGPWTVCSDKLNYSQDDTSSMIPYQKNLTLQGYRALIYSGDHDSQVPFTGTQAWMGLLEYMIIDGWRNWISANQESGYLQGYAANLTFLTIMVIANHKLGAGHMVPQDKPRESFHFYIRWLDGKRI